MGVSSSEVRFKWTSNVSLDQRKLLMVGLTCFRWRKFATERLAHFEAIIIQMLSCIWSLIFSAAANATPRVLDNSSLRSWNLASTASPAAF